MSEPFSGGLEPVAPTAATTPRRHSLRFLFLVAHAPMVVYAVGITAATAVLLPLLGHAAGGEL